MNKCHHLKSERKSCDSRVKNDKRLSFAASPYILDTKLLPGFTTFVACCNKPTRDSISLFVALCLCSQLDSRLQILWSFSPGRQASILLVSRVMPRKVRQSDGPSTFSRASGIPKSAHTALIVDKFWAQVRRPEG